VHSYKALEVTNDDGYQVRLVERPVDALTGKDVVVDVHYSDLNYKDGLTMTGRFGLVRGFPRVPGIDLVGKVIESADPTLEPGQWITANGWGLGTDHDGGLAQRAGLSREWVTPLPAGIDAYSAAAIGTAGYTAALAVLALRRLDITPDSGPVLVTGAAGGAGSIAIMLLSAFGYDIVASTGRRDQEEKSLVRLGAGTVIDRISDAGDGGLGKPRWAGAIDTVGSHTLVNVLNQTRYGGVVAAMGMAQGVDLPATVVPFITRSVSLAGIDSVYAPTPARVAAWDLLERHLDLATLAEITETVTLAEAPERARAVLAGTVRGRIVVDVAA
jgi:acrylyl-CoA reductase (NADPH)